MKAKVKDDTGTGANHGQEPDVIKDEDIPVLTMDTAQLREEK
ncbi:hypothetical protein [Pontibacter kalidii]|nr:hypothetical protein [Pontibacter kalidii]